VVRAHPTVPTLFRSTLPFDTALLRRYGHRNVRAMAQPEQDPARRLRPIGAPARAAFKSRLAHLANPCAFTHNSPDLLRGFFGGLMPSFRSFQPGAALAVALALLALPTAGHAYTDEEQQACQPDAFRLCGSEIPDVDRVTACMVARKSQLSPECRRFFRPDPEPAAAAAAAPAGKPMSIKPATARKPKPKPRKPAKPAAT
jgi:hypothetical protein